MGQRSGRFKRLQLLSVVTLLLLSCQIFSGDSPEDNVPATSASLELSPAAGIPQPDLQPESAPSPTPTSTSSAAAANFQFVDTSLNPKPKVVGRFPEAGAELAPDGVIEIFFDQPMEEEGLQKGWQLIDSAGNPVPGSITFPQPRILHFKPNEALERNAAYHATIAEGAKSVAGIPMLEGLTLTFKTLGDIEVSQFSPANNAINVDVTAGISVIFNKPVVPLLTAAEQADLPNPFHFAPQIAGNGEWINTSMYLFTPDPGMMGAVKYDVTVLADVVNGIASSGAILPTDVSWSFNTTAPTVANLEVRQGQAQYGRFDNNKISLDPAFQVWFNQPMERAATESAISLVPFDETPPYSSFAFAWNEDADHLVISTTQNLPYDTAYQLIMGESAIALGGGNLDRDYTLRVRTVPAPAILNTMPANGAGNAEPFNFQIRFASPMNLESLEGKVIIDPPISGEGDYYPWNNALSFSGLKPSTNYTVQILPGMSDIYGTEMSEGRAITFTTKEARPFVQMHLPGQMALLRQGGDTNLYALHRNVDQVDLDFFAIPAETFTRVMIGSSNLYSYLPRNEQRLWQRTVPVERILDDPGYARFDLAEGGVEPAPGFYFAGIDAPGVSHPNRRYAHTGLVVVANANLTMKTAPGEALLWATDLNSGQPIPNLPINLYDRRYNLIFQGVTDEQGIIYQDGLSLGVDYDHRYIAITESSDYFGVTLNSWGDRIQPESMGIFTDYYGEPGNAVAYVYTDRPLYRSDQEVYFKGIVRLDDDLDYSLPAFDSVRVIIDNYDGEIYNETLPLNPNGSFEGMIKLDSEATLGVYTIRVQQAGNYIGGNGFDVAEYRKPTYSVAVNPSADDVVTGDTVQATIKAEFFSGGAVANAEVHWSVATNPYTFAPGGQLNRFDFDSPQRDLGYCFHGCYDRYDYQPFGEIIAEGQGKTNGQGELLVELPAILTGEGGSQTFVVEATVVDVANNFVSGRASVVVHQAELYAGIRATQYIAREGEELSYELVAVDRFGETVDNQSITVELVERRWNSVQKQDARGNIRWESNVEEIPVDTVVVVTDGTGKATAIFVPPSGGVYRAYAKTTDLAGRESISSAYSWVAGIEYIPWRRSSDNNFDLIADSDSYAPGDNAQILIASPFQGSATALVTVERGHIKEYDVITLAGNSHIYDLPITGEMAPNIMVSVMIVKGVDENNPYPDYKVGYAQFEVSLEEQELNVEITADRDTTAPGETVAYTVQVTDHAGQPVQAELSMSLADLAVLSLSDRPENRILDFFYSQRWLRVQTALLMNKLIDSYNLELPTEVLEGGGSGGGGKGGFDEFGVDAVRQNFKDTAFWTAQIETDSNGVATVEVTLPDNLTTWRMDARAVTADTKVGQAVHDLRSTRPLMIQPQTPRFFVVNDQSQLRATVLNNSDQPLDAIVTLEAQGITLLDSASQNVTIPPGEQRFVAWDVAVGVVERVDAVFSVMAGELADASRPTLGTLDGQGIPVYRYEAPEIVGTSGQLNEAGAVVELIGLPAFDDYEISKADVTVTLAPSLAAAMTDGLKYLEHYEYECTEQTISRFLPNILTVRALQNAGISDPELEANLDRQVGIALQRIYRGQRNDGGWGWWSARRSSTLTTAYVLFALIEAKDAGYNINARVLADGTAFLQGNVERADGLRGETRSNRQSFLLFVLSRLGEPNPGLISELYDSRQMLALYGKAYLAQAIYLMDAGDPRLASLASDLNSAAILSATGAHWEEATNDYWNWNSDTRTTAIVLSALTRLEPDSKLTPNAVRWLMAHRTEGRWASTQETAWALIGLTDFMVATGELDGNYEYEVAINGELLGGDTVNAGNVRQNNVLNAGISQLLTDDLNRLAIGRGEGEGALYYTAHLNASLPAAHIQPQERGIILSRAYYHPDDPDTPVTTTQQGDTLVARLTLIAPSALHYVVVEDWLPAGLEAIDQTLKTSEQQSAPNTYDWNRTFDNGWGWWNFEHVELRDEKVVLSAGYLPAGTYEYVYLVRASTPGEYQTIPPIGYQFYFPEVYGRGAGSLFVVTE